MVEKVSDINYEVIGNYIHRDDGDVKFEEEELLTTFLNIAKEHVSQHTGIPIESESEGEKTLDSHPDFVLAILILCQDMYDNRTMYVDNKMPNITVQNILDMHRVNLL